MIVLASRDTTADGIGGSNHCSQEARPLVIVEQVPTCRVLATMDLCEEAAFYHGVDVIILAKTAAMHSPATYTGSPYRCERYASTRPR